MHSGVSAQGAGGAIPRALRGAGFGETNRAAIPTILVGTASGKIYICETASLNRPGASYETAIWLYPEYGDAYWDWQKFSGREDKAIALGSEFICL